MWSPDISHGLPIVNVCPLLQSTSKKSLALIWTWKSWSNEIKPNRSLGVWLNEKKLLKSAVHIVDGNSGTVALPPAPRSWLEFRKKYGIVLITLIITPLSQNADLLRALRYICVYIFVYRQIQYNPYTERRLVFFFSFFRCFPLWV